MQHLTSLFRREYMKPDTDRLDRLFRFVEEGELEVSYQLREAFITMASLQQMTDANGFIADTVDREEPFAHVLLNRIIRAVHRIRSLMEMMRMSPQVSERYQRERLKVETSLVNNHNSGQVIGTVWRANVTTRDVLFALHVVDETSQHNLLFSVLLKKKRRWWCPWKSEIKYQVLFCKKNV